MANIIIHLTGNRTLTRLDSFCAYAAKYVAITGNSAQSELYKFFPGYDGIYGTPDLPLTYRENWNPKIPEKASVKGTTLTNEEIDANFKVLERALISWKESFDWAQSIIAARYMVIKPIYKDGSGRSQYDYLERIDSTTGLLVDKGYVTGGYTLQRSETYNIMLKFYNNEPAALFVPPDGDLLQNDFPIGSNIIVSWSGGKDGVVSILPSTPAVTIISPDTNQIARKHGKITLIKTATNYWEIEGNLNVEV